MLPRVEGRAPTVHSRTHQKHPRRKSFFRGKHTRQLAITTKNSRAPWHRTKEPRSSWAAIPAAGCLFLRQPPLLPHRSRPLVFVFLQIPWLFLSVTMETFTGQLFFLSFSPVSRSLPASPETESVLPPFHTAPPTLHRGLYHRRTGGLGAASIRATWLCDSKTNTDVMKIKHNSCDHSHGGRHQPLNASCIVTHNPTE